MSSIDIYTSSKVHPYVYLLTHPITGEFYIGVRSANKIPSNLDLPIYKTSSSYVKPRFDEFEWIIIAEFFNKEDAYDFEQQMISESWGNPLLLNKACHHGNLARFSVSGMKHSEKTKQKLREARAKQPPPPGGWPKGPTPDAIEKIKLARKYQIITPETAKKISESNMGHEVSPETRRKISTAQTGKSFSDEHITNLSKSKKGIKRGPMSEDHKRKIADSHIGKSHSEDSKAKMRESALNRRSRKTQNILN